MKSKREILEQIIEGKQVELVALEVALFAMEKEEKKNSLKPILVPAHTIDKKGNIVNGQRQVFGEEQKKIIQSTLKQKEEELETIREYLNMV